MKAAATLFAALVLCFAARAQDRLIVADASSSGTYAKMLNEIKDVCASDDFVIEEGKNKGGATDNLQALATNQVQAAFLHSDVIYYASTQDASMKQFKTLVALYPEEIHILALRASKTSKLGNFSFGKQDFNTLSDFAGFTVGAAGGGVITAKILQGTGEVPFKVREFDSGKEVINALEAGTVDAAIFVGGAPLDNIAALNGSTFKLLPLGDSIANRVTGVYRPATINYPNLHSGTVRTMAPVATLVTRKYTTPKNVAPQARFRACFYAHLDELKETPGKHPKWAVVDPNDHGVWDWYDIPAVAAARSKR